MKETMLANALKKLDRDEEQLLFDSIALITILIAGSDGQIRDKELQKSENITKIRSFTNPDALGEFYARVGQDFNERLAELLEELPNNTDERTAELSHRLSGLTDILKKVDIDFGDLYYDSIKSLARHVAEAAGGFLGFGKISYEEAQLIDLPMIEFEFKG